MIWGNGEISAISFLRFSGETGKQGEYIYRRYILPFHRFSTGAKGAVGSRHSLPNSLLHLGGAL